MTPSVFGKLLAMKSLFVAALLFDGSLVSALAQTAAPSSPRSIKDYFQNNSVVVSRRAFYSADGMQRIEYHCEDENRTGGANAGASNPANVHCEATLFVRQSGQWMYSDEIDLRYGSVKEFAGHKLVIEMLEYGDEDARCCPSQRSTHIFNTGSGKFVEDNTANKKSNIVQAVKDGADSKRIAILIGQGNDVDARDKYGQTALMLAAEGDKAEITKMLLKHNADVRAKRSDGKTALIIAADKGSTEVVKALLDGGADPNIQTDAGRSALSYAVQSDNSAIALLLIERGADVNVKAENGATPLATAITHGSESLVILLLEKGANLHATYEGSTMLVTAGVRSKCGIVRRLLDKGASASERNWGEPALSRIAAYSRNTDCLKALVERGADINGKNNRGETPLFSAALYGPVENVKWLLENGANPNVIVDGMTPLETARKLNKKDMVKFLEMQLQR